MTTVRLFGLDVAVPSHGSIGGLHNQLDVVLSPDSTRLTIGFEGAHPLGDATFQATLACSVSGGVVRLTPTLNAGAGADMVVTLPFSLGTTRMTPVQLVVTEAGEFAFRDSRFFLSSRLPRVPILEQMNTLGWREQSEWADFVIVIDMSTESLHFYPLPGKAHSELTLNDSFSTVRPIPRPVVHRRQELAIQSVTATLTTIDVVALARQDILFVHPDILSTVVSDTSQNEFLFQYALVNGALHLAIRGDGASARTFHWGSRRDRDVAPGLLVFRLTDEHGHPLLLESTGGFPLQSRTGTSVSKEDGSGDRWEQTNPAVVVCSPEALPVTIHSIDPLCVGSHSQDHEMQWLDSTGRVRTSGRSPLEIHGLAKGTFLRRIDRQNKPITNASLATEPITDQRARHLFTRSELSLPIRSDDSPGATPVWQLMSQLEEREVAPGVSAAPAGGKVGHRVSAPKGSTLRLPLIDTSYALANLADPGMRVTEGLILATTREWLTTLDAQFSGEEPTHFERPVTDQQTHVTGFGVSPLADHGVFDSILDLPPGRAADVSQTARTGAQMRDQALHYFHGGQRDETAHETLVRTLEQATATFRTPFEEFTRFWNSLALSGVQDLARKELRRLMGFVERAKLPDEEIDRMLPQVQAVLFGGRRIDELEPDIVEKLRKNLARFVDTVPGKPLPTPEEFRALWRQTGDPHLGAFFDLLSTSTGPSIYRRAVDILQNSTLQELPSRDELSKVIKAFAGSPDDLLPGFPTPARLGITGAVLRVTEAWATLPALQLFRLRFGFSLTLDVYRLLLKREHQADLQEVLALYFLSERFRRDLFGPDFVTLAPILENRWNESAALKGLRDRLGRWERRIFEQLLEAERKQLLDAVVLDLVEFFGKLPLDPPEYFFFSSRVRIPLRDDARRFMEQLWTQKFHLVSPGEGSLWSFVLDGDTSVVVKLTSTRPLLDLLRDIQTSYGTETDKDPLGLGGMTLDEFGQRLDPDLREPSWRGVLVLRPTADLSRDVQLSTLTGLRDLPTLYVAIGGARPEKGAGDLDVYASISYVRKPLSVEGTPPEDLSLALIKFDATIRHTRLVAGEVLFQLDIRNLLGRDATAEKWDPLMLRGTVARDSQSKGNSFEFSGWFERPIEYPVEVAFLDKVKFKTLRVSTSRGQTSVDIDATLTLRRWQLPVGGQGFAVGPDDDHGSELSLQNLRILMPRLDPGRAIPIGFPRLLNFELPAISFTWPRPRPLNLGNGIELAPLGMGFIRRVKEAKEALTSLQTRYQWLFGRPEGDIYQLPYLRCSIHFGKLPAFGGTNLSRLDLELVIALVIDRAGGAPSIKIGVGGLDASEITVDLFGIIKLEIKRLLLDRFETMDKKQVVALLVDDPRLTLLGWSPIPPDGHLKFLFAQAEASPGVEGDGRAVLGFYRREEPSDSFFKLFWLLVAHNFELSETIHQHLLSSRHVDHPERLLDGLVDLKKKKLASRVLSDGSWMFGASFGLGNIVEQGTFVLHDQHYYGISLRGKAIEALFNVDRLELSYMPGPTRAQDRFRTSFRIAALDFIGNLRSGDIAIEWGFNWDFLLDFGFPWKSGAAYQWERAFSLPMGAYEAKFGLYIEKRTQLAPAGTTQLTLSAGVGFYLGYYVGFGTPGRFVWAQAGIGIFAILEGSIRFRLPPAGAGGVGLIKSTIEEIRVRGVIGIFAYGEGGIEIWVISARFRVSVQAAIAGELHYLPGGNSSLSYAATLSASYSASCRVGCGFFRFTFRVRGRIDFEVSGQALLN